MANNRRRHAMRPVLDPMVDLYRFTMPARFGGVVLHWTPGPYMSWGTNLVSRAHYPHTAPKWNAGGAVPVAPFNGLANVVNGLWTCPDMMAVGFDNAYGPGMYCDLVDNQIPTRSPAQPGQWFEAQARIRGLYTPAQVLIIWMGPGGATYVGEAASALIQPRPFESVSKPGDLELVSIQAQAPAGTSFACMLIRGLGYAGGGTGSWVLFTQPQLARIDAPGAQPLAFQQPSVLKSTVNFGGIPHFAVPIQFTGMEVTSQGAIPRPRIQLPNIDNFIRSYMASFGNLLGAKVERRQVFAYALDDGARPDPTDFYGPEIFYVDRMVTAAPEVVEFELCSPFDLQGKMLPNWQVIRDVCTHGYRAWNAATNSYVQGTCPYAGAGRWDENGVATADPAKDDCGRRLSDCKLRFPDPNEALPTRAFPGVSLYGR